MKLVIAADLHLRPNNPISRSDDYCAATLRKLKQLIDYCNANDRTLLIAGDVFDKPDVPIWYLNKVIEVFSDLKVDCYTVAGNHDLKFHNVEFLEDSALWTITMSVDRFKLVNVSMHLDTDTWLHPRFFGLEPDTVPYESKHNILMLHTPVFEKEAPWYMKEAMTADQLVDKYPDFDLYLTGDIHIPFITDKVINPGSMMRSTKAQKDHRPCFVEVDTDTNEKIVHYFDIEEDVWKLEFEEVADESFSADLDELSQVLLARDEKLSYKEVVLDLSSTDRIKKRFMGIIDGYDNERS